MAKTKKFVEELPSLTSPHWGRTSTDSCLPVQIRLQNRCDCKKTDSVVLGKGFLTAEMVDSLEATCQNWIIDLDYEQILKMQGGEAQYGEFKQALSRTQRVAELLAAVPLALYEALEVNNTVYWVAMFSCWIGGWGRVRLLVVCRNPLSREPKTLLVTNRLEWSPSRLLRLSLQADFS